VPDGFDPPRELDLPEFHLVPLGPQHNESDHAAWSSSIAHIRATPGFESWGWPPVEGMSLDANRDDLERHARDFAERTGFTFTVLKPGTEEVIGCLYIYPAKDGGDDGGPDPQAHLETVRCVRLTLQRRFSSIVRNASDAKEQWRAWRNRSLRLVQRDRASATTALDGGAAGGPVLEYRRRESTLDRGRAGWTRAIV
jgi:hypothetical protein